MGRHRSLPLPEAARARPLCAAVASKRRRNVRDDAQRASALPRRQYTRRWHSALTPADFSRSILSVLPRGRALLNLATETDLERLRQAALLLEQENTRLFRRLEALVAELAEARGEEARSLQLEIGCLKEQLASRTKALFGDSSERRPREEQTEERKEPRPGHGPRDQKALPIVEVVHELDEPDQMCPSCGGDLEPMTGQFEEADEIDGVERSSRIVRHKRQKYRCRCGAGIETALGSEKLVPGGRYSRASPEERLATLAALRVKQSKPVVDEIRAWLMTQRALPRSALGKAIAYTGGLWTGLVRFLENPKIPLDTNGVERALRGVAVGRKNHYGSRSERGTRVAALLYSLIESAKLAGVEPRAYLGEAARQAIRNPGTVTLARDFK